MCSVSFYLSGANLLKFVRGLAFSLPTQQRRGKCGGCLGFEYCKQCPVNIVLLYSCVGVFSFNLICGIRL